jgi:hypothetical protein
MGLFTILTLKNIRQQAKRIQPALTTGNETLRRIDSQMVRMLFSQVLTQLLCVLPFAVISIVALFINTVTDLFNFFQELTIIPLFASYAISFYIFTLSSRVYRQELMKIIGFWKPRQVGDEQTIGTVATNPITRQHWKTITTSLHKQ